MKLFVILFSEVGDTNKYIRGYPIMKDNRFVKFQIDFETTTLCFHYQGMDMAAIDYNKDRNSNSLSS